MDQKEDPFGGNPGSAPPSGSRKRPRQDSSSTDQTDPNRPSSPGQPPAGEPRTPERRRGLGSFFSDSPVKSLTRFFEQLSTSGSRDKEPARPGSRPAQGTSSRPSTSRVPPSDSKGKQPVWPVPRPEPGSPTPIRRPGRGTVPRPGGSHIRGFGHGRIGDDTTETPGFGQRPASSSLVQSPQPSGSGQQPGESSGLLQSSQPSGPEQQAGEGSGLAQSSQPSESSQEAQGSTSVTTQPKRPPASYYEAFEHPALRLRPPAPMPNQMPPPPPHPSPLQSPGIGVARPPSPWKKKFGGDRWTPLNNQWAFFDHSGYAPLLPRLDPKFHSESELTYATRPPWARPSDHELDMLFASETEQLWLNNGMPTWESVLLEEDLANEWPGGHRRDDRIVSWDEEQSALVKVDESNWVSFWKRDKWYNFDTHVVDSRFFTGPVDGVAFGEIWTVDNGRIWFELRQCIELANRLLRLFAQHRFLRNIVTMTKREWPDAVPQNHVLNSGMADVILGPNGHPLHYPDLPNPYHPNEIFQELENLLANRMVLSFFDDDHILVNSMRHMETYGFTMVQSHLDQGEDPANSFIAIRFHVHPLRVLLKPDSTVAERIHARCSFAGTMVHELMHAIHSARSLANPTLGDKEPFYGQDWEIELGHSAIKNLFGYDYAELPKVSTPYKTGLKYAIAGAAWPKIPSDAIESIRGQPINIFGKTWEDVPVPSAWWSALSMEDFWQNAVKRYGLEAVRMPRVYRTETSWWGFYIDPKRADMVHNSNTIIRAKIYPQILSTMAATHARRTLWEGLRPWAQQEFAVWRKSPYSNTRARRIIDGFTEATRPHSRAARPLVAEYHAAVAAESLSDWLLFRQDRDDDIPLPARDDIFKVFAHMMEAVLPKRLPNKGVRFKIDRRRRCWHPSNAAKTAGQGRWEFGSEWFSLEKNPAFTTLSSRHLVRREVMDDMGLPTGRRLNSRQWHLHSAARLLEQIERTTMIPEPLSLAIDNELKSLVNQALVRRDEDWLDWNFVWPRYSSIFTQTTNDGTVGSFPLGIVQTSPPPLGFLASVTAMPAQARGGGTGSRTEMDRIGRPLLKHYTISQVGDVNYKHDYRDRCWVVVKNPKREKDVAIYDIASVFNDRADLDPKQVLYWTRYGKAIHNEELYNYVVENLQPVGKLVFGYTLPEIMECDGQQGKPWFVVIDRKVFDINWFNYHGSDEVQLAIIDLGERFWKKGPLKSSDVSPELMRLLEPYLCGVWLRSRVAQNFPEGIPLQPEPPVKVTTERIFTQRDVERHIYPEVGMYCILGDEVWDLGRYMYHHPGGYEILRKYAGTDITGVMQSMHGAHIHQQIAAWRPTLRVGRVIEERTESDPIDNDEVALFNIVYKIPSFNDLIRIFVKPGGDALARKLLREMRQFAGTDASRHITEEWNGLRFLLQHNEYARTIRCTQDRARRRITTAELRDHAYIPRTREEKQEPAWLHPPQVEPEMTRDAQADAENAGIVGWVAVPERDGRRWMVYNVTTIMKYDDTDLEPSLRRWLGDRVRDEELSEHMRTRRRGFIIGELLDDERQEPQDVVVTYRPSQVPEERLRRPSAAPPPGRHPTYEFYDSGEEADDESPRKRQRL